MAAESIPIRELCVACGYDISNLPLESKCPECGLSISQSFAKSHLIRPSSRFRRTLLCGSSLAVFGIGLSYLGAAVVVAISRSRPSTLDQPESLRLAVLSIGHLIWYGGWFLFASSERGVVERSHDKLIRRVLQVLCVVSGICVALLWVYWTQIDAASSQSAFGRAAEYVSLSSVLARISNISAVVSIAILPAMMLRVQQIAPRLPSPGIDKFAGLLCIAGPAVQTLQYFRIARPYSDMASFGVNVLAFALVCWITVRLIFGGAQRHTASL